MFQKSCAFQPEVTILHLGGCPSFCIRLFCVSLRRNQDPPPSPLYFLTASPFFSCSPSTPLISNCLHLLFETRTWKDCCVLEGLTGFCCFSLILVIFCDSGPFHTFLYIILKNQLFIVYISHLSPSLSFTLGLPIWGHLRSFTEFHFCLGVTD